jgi:hypothetical protein
LIIQPEGGTVGYFRNCAEVERYVGGILEIAAARPDIAGRLETSATSLRIVCSDPVCELNVSLSPPMTVDFGPSEIVPVVTLLLPADAMDGYFRGRYSILEGLARGDIRARGPISRILKILPFTDPLIPLYRELVAAKDAESLTATN